MHVNSVPPWGAVPEHPAFELREGNSVIAGVRFENVGPNNVLHFPRGKAFAGFRVNLAGRSECSITLDEGCNFTHDSLVTIEGDKNNAVFCGGGGSSKVNFTMRGEGGFLYYGRNCTANFVNLLVQGVPLIIGHGCLFSWGITLRTFDSHAIFDTETGEQINRAQPLTIEPHCWIAQDVTIMPGVTIGSGAIVGAGSIVTKSISPKSLAVGVPARVIREGVSWTREPFPEKRHIAAALAEITT